MIYNGEQWSAQFLRNEPHYDEPAWIDAYANAIGRCKPELTPESAVMKAYLAFAREGDWNNPKIAAWGDAMFGPLYLDRHLQKPPLQYGPGIKIHFCAVCGGHGWLCTVHPYRPVRHDGCMAEGTPCGGCQEIHREVLGLPRWPEYPAVPDPQS
jgi:hypothetical protein